MAEPEIPASVFAYSQAPRSLRDSSRELRGPQVIKNYCLEFLQIMYSDPKARRRWDQDEEKAEILIIDKYTFNLETVEKRPAIVASRGPVGWSKTSGFRQMQHQDQMTDRRIYTDLIDGSVTLSCFAREGLESEAIATDVYEWFTMFQDAIRTRGSFRQVLDRMGLFRVSSVSIGEEALVKSDGRPDLSVTPVVVRAMVQRRWMQEATAPKLKNVHVTVSRET
jgi:hypothetical protein